MSTLAPYADARALLLAANLIDPALIHAVNEPFEQPQSQIWMSVETTSDVLDIIDLGANNWRESGQIMIFLYAPAQTGTDALRTLAKAVCNTFRHLGPRNPYYHNQSISSGGLDDTGAFYVLPVSIGFHYED